MRLTIAMRLLAPAAWLVAPLGLAGLGWLVARAIPPGAAVWLEAARAVLLSAPRWAALLLPLWALPVGFRLGAPLLGLAVAAGGIVLAGLPPRPGPPPPRPPGALRVLVANVQAYAEPPDPEGLGRAIAALEPDVAVLLERRADAVPGMRRVADNFERGLERPSHGSAVFARSGVAARVTEEFGSERQRMPLAVVRLDTAGGPVCLLGIHAPPPVPFKASGNLPYAERIASWIEGGRLARDVPPCRTGDPVLVAGDLNHVPGSPAWRALRAAGLADLLARRGAWAASWPAGGGWPDFPVFRLDHVLAGAVPRVRVHQLRLPGSDHRALLLDLPAPAGTADAGGAGQPARAAISSSSATSSSAW